MNQTVCTVDGLDHRYTPEEYSPQTDAHMLLLWENKFLILWLIVNGT